MAGDGLEPCDAHLGRLSRERTGLTGCGDQKLADTEDAREGTGAPGVVIVCMGQHHSVECSDPGPGERLTQRACRWSGVDQERVRPVAYEDGVTLPHIERGHECAIRRTRPGQHDQQYENRGRAHEPRAPCTGTRPPRPQPEGASPAQERHGGSTGAQRDRCSRQGGQKPCASGYHVPGDTRAPQHHLTKRRDNDPREQPDDGDNKDQGHQRAAHDVGHRSHQRHDPESRERNRQCRRLSDQRQCDGPAERTYQRR